MQYRGRLNRDELRGGTCKRTKARADLSIAALLQLGKESAADE